MPRWCSFFTGATGCTINFTIWVFTEAAGNFKRTTLAGAAWRTTRSKPTPRMVRASTMPTSPHPMTAKVRGFKCMCLTARIPAPRWRFGCRIILHEFTHGLSTRLVGGGGGHLANCRPPAWAKAGPDFYALSLLSEESDDPAGNYVEGGYVTDHFFGLTQKLLLRNPPLSLHEGPNETRSRSKTSIVSNQPAHRRAGQPG